VLSIAPDLTEPTGEAWAQERLLGPKVEAGGFPYRVAANLRWKTVAENETVLLPVSASFVAYSRTLIDRQDDARPMDAVQRRRAERELRAVIEGALLASPSRVHAVMRFGSLQHAAVLYELSLTNPRLSAHVTLHWLRSADVWEPDFMRRWAWLLRAATREPRLTLVCTTEHQRRELAARSGISLAVAAQPSSAIDDEEAWALLSGPQRGDSAQRVLLPLADGDTERAEETLALAEPLSRALAKRRAELLVCGEAVNGFETGPESLATLLVGGTEPQEFLSHLRSSKAVVLPHLPPRYADHTAGVAVDALYSGAALIALRGTAPAWMIDTYHCGVVVDEGRPDEIAAAVDRLVAPAETESFDLRAAGKAYFRKNSWHRLAKDVIASMPTPAVSPLVPATPDGDQVAVPLIGPLPRRQEGRVREIRATLELLAAFGIEMKAAALAPQSEGAVLQILNTETAGIALGEDRGDLEGLRRTFVGSGMPMPSIAALQDTPEGGLTATILDMLGPEGRQGESVLVTFRPTVAGETIQLVEELRPIAAIVSFDDSLGAHHGDLAREFDAKGYTVLVSELHPRLRSDGTDAAWRVAAYPFVSDLPWARGRLLVVPPQVSLAYIKYVMLETGQSLAYEDEDDPAQHSQEIWAQAPKLEPGKALAHAPGPGEVWRREAFTVQGQTPEKMFRLRETESTRVHRTFIRGKVKEGRPLTFSVDCVQDGRRFVSLWLSDVRHKARCEAVFDLESGLPVGSNENFEDPSVSLEAGAVVTGETNDGWPIYRLWISVSAYPFSEEVQAQLVTRSSSGGSKQHRGDPERGVIARDMLLELTPIPSRVR